MDATAHENKKPNRLLLGLLIVSMGAHVLVLGHFAGLYKIDTVRYIELEVRSDKKKPGRSIPVPPRRRKVPVRSDAPRMKQMVPRPMEKPISPPVAPSIAAIRPSIIEPIAISPSPEASKPELLSWSPPAPEPEIEAPSSPEPSTQGSPADYFRKVRMMIESNKRYPLDARRRRIEGRVVVRFIIETDGRVTNVSPAKKSQYGLLNEAAMESVKASSPFPKPPKDLFSGPIPLEISIVFELT